MKPDGYKTSINDVPRENSQSVCIWIVVDKKGANCTNRTRSAMTLGQLPVSPVKAEISALNIDCDPKPS